MSRPKNIAAIDLMLSIPGADQSSWYEFLKPLLRDEESLKSFSMPAQYMFKDIPKLPDQKDYIEYTVSEMDKWGIERAMLGISNAHELNAEAIAKHPDRFFASYGVSPQVKDEAKNIKRLHNEQSIKAITAFPSGVHPQVPINDKLWHPIYETACELDIPICCTVGVPGPRIPMAPQKVELIDEVCWYFPKLKFVMRHGAEPWVDLAIKLMLKYPNLYYSTSAFAPKHYPKAIIDYANSRGADKILYAGYFPMGLSLERIFTDMDSVPLNANVWPKFLRENALRVFKLE